MPLKELAQALVDHNRNDTVGELLDTHYHTDCVSVEAAAMPGGDGSREAKGLDAIRGKHAWWEANMEMQDGSIEGPYLHGDDRFAVIFKSRMKNKQSGEESDLEEVAVYHVADDKIVREEFFYTM